MGVKGMIKKVGEIPAIISYESELQAMRGQYGEWLFWQEHNQELKENAEYGNAETLSEGYFGSHPLHAIQAYFSRHPKVMILYGNEDVKGKDGSFEHPWFRPNWSPELLESRFYLGSLIAFRRSFLRENMDLKEILSPYRIRGQEERTEDGTTEREDTLEGMDNALVFLNETPDEVYRNAIVTLCERAGGWERGHETIARLPGVIYHCSKKENLLGFADPATGFTKKEETPKALLSVIILTKDHPELLEHCLNALSKACEASETDDGQTETIHYEVVVVDNGSSQENRERQERILGITYLYEPMDFNFSKLCNIGARAAKGMFFLFLNDDVELLTESKLGQMLRLAARPGVGSVGLKLYYPDSTIIQHAGITNLPMGPVHKLLFLDDKEEYYYGRNRGLSNMIAVSAACVMLRREVFEEAGGFEESLPVAYNDVALGFRLYELGYRSVVVCNAYAYHHESLTRGSDGDEKKRERLFKEQARLYQMFPKFQNQDPYFSEYLSKQATDTRIRPAYETMRNVLQLVSPVPMEAMDGFRMDPCLSVAVEEDRNGELLGYAVVLGDDNACYERFLILEKDSGERYQVRLSAQYRPDLEEKMPDQLRVALCGFWICLTKGTLPTGRYRVGCLAKRKVGNLKLFYWSEHHWHVTS